MFSKLVTFKWTLADEADFLCRSIQLYTSTVNVTTLAFAMKRNPFNHFLFYGGLFISLGLIVKAAGRYAAFIFAMTAPCRC